MNVELHWLGSIIVKGALILALLLIAYRLGRLWQRHWESRSDD